MHGVEMNILTGEVRAVELSPQEVEQIRASAKEVAIAAPKEVTRFQARAALYQAGLLDDVEALIAAHDTDMLLKLAWQDAQTFKRQSPFIISVAGKLGLSDAQLDELFIAASQIE